jgi:hypothetical protein
MGLGSCWVFFVQLAFLSPQGPELLRDLRIPEGYKPVCSAVLGHREGEVPEAAERKTGLVTMIT